MRCPVCEETLQMTDRQGVEIDYCPKCRGIWLDRGELEKLIERSAAQLDTGYRRDDRDLQAYRERDRHDDHEYRGKHKKRESWLGRILDFD